MKNYVQVGRVLTVPAPVAVLGGEALVIGDLKGVASGDAEAGASVDLHVEGVFRLPKIASAFAVGDVAHFDPTLKLITADVASPRLGVVVAAALADAATCDVRING